MCGKRLDLAGIQLGHLTVLEATDHRSSQGSIIWRCRCDCGNEILLPSSSIRNSHIADCGCRRSKRYANADITGQRFGRLAALYATDRRTTQVIKSGIVIVIAETRLMFHTKLWCMAISKAVAAKKENMKANLAPI